MRNALDPRPVADAAAVVRGENFRITVLADGLLRLEHSNDGRFEDRASAFALYRDLPTPEFRVVDGPTHLEVITERLHLIYDRRPFSTNGLSVQVRGNISSYHSVWRFGEVPADFGGTARTLDMADGAVPLEPGIMARWGFGVIDDSKTLVFDDDGWVAPRDGSRIDLYFFGYGHDYRDAIRAFYAVSGPTPVLPRFALGNWWSRYHPYSAAEYEALMTRFADAGIPFSVSVLDMDWHPIDVDPQYGSGWTGYSWNRELIPEPAEFLSRLHDRGLRFTLNVHPADGVRAFEDSYPDVAAALGLDPARKDPIAFDVTNQEFLTAYFDVLHRSLERDGVDFWWIDWQSGPHSRIAGVDPLWMLNHFHFLDNASDGRRPLILSRYAGPGSHRYPVGFSGDTLVTWASLDFQPYFTATASNIGYGWWSHDIGGHMFGAKNDELASRWVQLGVFSPILRLHSSLSPFNTKEPWRFGAQAERVMTDALRFRHRLLPYLHTMNHLAAHEASPLVQPMYWSHPEAPAAYRAPNQFAFGTQLMVAPITAPADPLLQLGSVRTWLPPGTWTDLFTGLRYDGNRELQMHRDADSIPVLAPAGAIVPLAGMLIPDNDPGNPVELEVLVVLGADGAFTLIEDAETADSVVHTPIRFEQATGTLTVDAASGPLSSIPADRSWRLTFLGLADATPSVTVDGAVVGAGVEHSADGLSVTVGSVSAGAALTVQLGPDPTPAPNDVATRIFALLDAAQLEFSVKQQVYSIVTAADPLSVRVSHLLALALHRPLETAVTEILLA